MSCSVWEFSKLLARFRVKRGLDGDERDRDIDASVYVLWMHQMKQLARFPRPWQWSLDPAYVLSDAANK